MSRQHDSMIHPSIENLLNRESLEGSKFALVTLASYRARQINSYFNQLGEGLGQMVPPQVSSVARKPLSIAFEEFPVFTRSTKQRFHTVIWKYSGWIG